MTVTAVGAEMHPAAFFTVTLYVPGVTPEKIPDVFVYVLPSMLKKIPAAGAGEVTVIVPVATEHVGWITSARGAAGVSGEALTVTAVGADMHPAAFLTVTL